MKIFLIPLFLTFCLFLSACSKETVYKSFYKSGKQAECERILREEGYLPEECQSASDRDYEQYKKDRKELEEQNKYK